MGALYRHTSPRRYAVSRCSRLCDNFSWNGLNYHTKYDIHDISINPEIVVLLLVKALIRSFFSLNILPYHGDLVPA